MSGLFVYTAEEVTRPDGSKAVIYWAKNKGGKDREVGIAFDGDGYNIARQSQAESIILAAEIGEKKIDEALENM